MTAEDVENIYYMTVVSRDGIQGTDEAPAAYVKKILAAVENVHYAVQEEMVKNKRCRKKPRIIFEVFVDEGGLGNKCSEYDDVLGVSVFGTKWLGLSSPTSIRQEFMEWVRRMRPEEIFMAPPCGPWCRWNEERIPELLLGILPTSLLGAAQDGKELHHRTALDRRVLEHS